MLEENVGPAGRQDTAVERRRGRRFQLRLSCRVAPAFREGTELPGSTNDISRSGVCVLLKDVTDPASVPRMGESVRVLIDLPHTAIIAPRCLECLGTAVRREAREKNEFLLAVEIRRIRVCDRNGQTHHPGDSFLASVLLRGPGKSVV